MALALPATDPELGVGVQERGLLIGDFNANYLTSHPAKELLQRGHKMDPEKAKVNHLTMGEDPGETLDIPEAPQANPVVTPVTTPVTHQGVAMMETRIEEVGDVTKVTGGAEVQEAQEVLEAQDMTAHHPPLHPPQDLVPDHIVATDADQNGAKFQTIC